MTGPENLQALDESLQPLAYVDSFEAELRVLVRNVSETLSPFNRNILDAALEDALSHARLRGLRRALELQLESPQRKLDKARLEQFLLWKFKEFVTLALYPSLYRAALRMELNREEFILDFFGDLNELMRKFGIFMRMIEEDENFAREVRIMYGESATEFLGALKVGKKRPKISKGMSIEILEGKTPGGNGGAFIIENIPVDSTMIPEEAFLVGRPESAAPVEKPAEVMVEKFEEVAVHAGESRKKILNVLLAAGLLFAARACADHAHHYSVDDVVQGHMIFDAHEK